MEDNERHRTSAKIRNNGEKKVKNQQLFVNESTNQSKKHLSLNQTLSKSNCRTINQWINHQHSQWIMFIHPTKPHQISTPIWPSARQPPHNGSAESPLDRSPTPWWLRAGTLTMTLIKMGELKPSTGRSLNSQLVLVANHQRLMDLGGRALKNMPRTPGPHIIMCHCCWLLAASPLSYHQNPDWVVFRGDVGHVLTVSSNQFMNSSFNRRSLGGFW